MSDRATSPDDAAAEVRAAELRRSERTMVWVRAGGALFALVQVLAYRERPYPPGVKGWALALAALLASADVVIWLLARRERGLATTRRLALGALVLDLLVASAFTWLYAFDPSSALWAVLYIIPLEGAIRFQLPGALWSWAAVTALYVGREIFRVNVFPGSTRGPAGFGLQPESISFRMGIGLLIALVAGLMARSLVRQAARLRSALDEVQRVDRLRARLVSTLAHDVRNPLTAIRGTHKTLLTNWDRLERPTAQDLLKTADHQAGRLERLSRDLLDLARLERGRLQLHVEDVNLSEAVGTALSYVTSDGDPIEVHIDRELSVRADPGRLEQIVVNLASNAVRYGGPPFAIDATRADGSVVIRFTDHGDGVPPDKRDLLFEPFSGDERTSSVGFGLAIVRALAEAHGGSVAYESVEPSGACFRLVLPAGS